LGSLATRLEAARTHEGCEQGSEGEGTGRLVRTGKRRVLVKQERGVGASKGGGLMQAWGEVDGRKQGRAREFGPDTLQLGEQLPVQHFWYVFLSSICKPNFF